MTNPLRVDPSRTATIRRQFENGIHKRFNTFLKKLRELGSAEPTANKYSHGAVIHFISDPRVLEYVRRVQYALSPKMVTRVEQNPHITVMPGLHTEVLLGVEEVLHTTLPFTVQTTGMSLFESEEHDVLKLDLKSKKLVALNSELQKIPHESLYKRFSPHITIAYINKKKGRQQLGQVKKLFKPLQLEIDQVTYSRSNGIQTTYPLDGGVPSINSKSSDFDRYMELIDDLINGVLLGEEDENFLEEYIQEAYELGTARAFDEVSRSKSGSKRAGFYDGTRAQFLKDSFSKPVTLDRVKILAQGALGDYTPAVAGLRSGIVRALVDGMVLGKSPIEVARSLDIEGLVEKAKGRALTVARTETLRAHNEGALYAMEEMGVEEIGVLVELSTAEDEKVCPICSAYEGVVMKIADAHGLFPLHPNCRCVPIPSGFDGEEVDPKKVKRLKLKVKSLKMTKAQREAIAEAKRRSSK